MKSRLDIMVTSGIWPRLVGGGCTEIMKHYSTRHCARGLNVWAWDTDKRGGDGLVPDPMHAAPACLDARNRAHDLALRTERLADEGVAIELAASFNASLGISKAEQPILALATVTSRKTFRRTLELLRETTRPVLLLGMADFPQDTVSATGLAEREAEGLHLLRQAVGSNRNLAALVLSRGAFTGDVGTMDDSAKQLFMNCIQHVLWLILTHDRPEHLLLQWHEIVKQEPTADWFLGHLQLDCSGSGNAIRGHTLLKDGVTPWELDQTNGSVTVIEHNHLGLRLQAEKSDSKAAHVFSESGHAPRISIPGIEPVQHDTYLVDRVDLVFLNRSIPSDHKG